MRPARALAVAGLGVALTLTACGATTDAGGTSAADPSTAQLSRTEHNDADVAFATEMIQHHAQALSMVDLTIDRPLDPEVRALADDILAAQAPEIEKMSDWLQEWGEEVPATVRDHAHAGHGDKGEGGDAMEGMDDTEMPGTMSAEEMAALEDAGNAEFQDLWLDSMVEHHQGAVEMAEAEQADGLYEPAVDLAEDIARSQTEEISRMEGLLS
jgi:uncharacterized protein (DUF305 family)